MPLDLNAAQVSDMKNSVGEYEVPTKSLDGSYQQKETKWINTKWTTYWGYFNAIADLKSAMIMKAIWDVGKGYVADDFETEAILEHISGWGKDTFDDVLFNMLIQMRVGGDAYAERILDEESGTLLNLKPLDPGRMAIIVDESGMILRYEYSSVIKDREPQKFKPDEIFHLCNNRVGNQIHGISDIEALEETIKADEESFGDVKKVMHRQAKPLIMFKIKTDNETKIANFILKMDKATKQGDNIYIPDDENTVEYEVVQVNVSQIILEWRNDVRNKFWRTIGVPQIIPGAGGQGTESEGKVIYGAFEQITERSQRFLEQQLWNQLQIKINLIPPPSLLPNLQADTSKDSGQMKAEMNPAGVEE